MAKEFLARKGRRVRNKQRDPKPLLAEEKSVHVKSKSSQNVGQRKGKKEKSADIKGSTM
jgi:hypothetical protein